VRFNSGCQKRTSGEDLRLDHTFQRGGHIGSVWRSTYPGARNQTARRLSTEEVRGGFEAFQAAALEALQLAGLRPQLVVVFSRIRNDPAGHGATGATPQF